MLSYIAIFWFIWSNGKYWKQNGDTDVKEHVTKRELLVIRTISLVCICYIVFVTSNVYCAQIFGTWLQACNVIRCLYYFQYSLNFFIYAASSYQYRQAYLFFLQRINPLESYNSMYFDW